MSKKATSIDGDGHRAKEVSKPALCSSKGQSLYRRLLSEARHLGWVDKRGRVRPALKGEIRAWVEQAVLDNCANEAQLLERVRASIQKRSEKRRHCREG